MNHKASREPKQGLPLFVVVPVILSVVFAKMVDAIEDRLSRMPRRPVTGRRTAPGHPLMHALRWARVIAAWAVLCSAPLVAITLIVVISWG